MMYTKAQLEGMKMKELVDVAWELDIKINPKGSKAKAVVQIWAAQRKIEDHMTEVTNKEVAAQEATAQEIKDAEKETKEQLAPKRGALIEYKGKSQNICAWAKELGKSPNTLYGRIYRLGWSVEKAFES